MSAPFTSLPRPTAFRNDSPGAATATASSWSAPATGAELYVSCLASMVLLAAASRPWAASPALAWVAFMPTFHLVQVLAARRRFLLAAVCGALTALGVTSVAYEATLALSLPAYLVVASAAALPFGAACGAAAFVVARLRGGARRLVWLVPPVFWCCAELATRQEWLAGAWAPSLAVIGYSQAETPAVHLARLGSVTAVSLAVLLANALALEAVHRVMASARLHGWAPRTASATLLPVGGLGLLALVVWSVATGAPAATSLTAVDGATIAAGKQAVGEAVATPGQAVAAAPAGEWGVTRIVVVQPNLPATARAAAGSDETLAAELLATLADLSRSAGTGTAAVTVWPEGVWPGRLGYVSSRAASGAPLTGDQRLTLAGLAPLLIGAASRDEDAGAYGNSAFVLVGSELIHVADKRRLVPFAEAGLTAGTTQGATEVGGVLVVPVICYDIAFPATVRAAARDGAELLAVITDDTFAAGGDVPLQHLRVARLRAVENGVWSAFASNGGPSAIIDPAGRLVERSTPGVATTLGATARLRAGSTPYSRYGDWAGVLTCLAALGLVGAAGREGGGYRRSPSA